MQSSRIFYCCSKLLLYKFIILSCRLDRKHLVNYQSGFIIEIKILKLLHASNIIRIQFPIILIHVWNLLRASKWNHYLRPHLSPKSYSHDEISKNSFIVLIIVMCDNQIEKVNKYRPCILYYIINILFFINLNYYYCNWLYNT